MEYIYPLNVIVSDNASLQSAYNADPTSVLLLSACLTPQELQSHVEKKVQFDTVITVDPSPQDVASQVMPSERTLTGPNLIRYEYPGKQSNAIEELHQLLMTPITHCGMGDG